jgi:transcriptional regulator with XRE-family HTH domain
MTTPPRSPHEHVPEPHNRRQRRRNPDLSEFLRSRRARLSPADVGLSVGPRRRTPGLRREEVAQLSGIGVTWYTWLEQGRPINASQQVLDAVARTLRLDATEREHLYHLAGAPLQLGPQALPQQVPPELQTVLDALDPLPAVVYNSRFDILAFNQAHEAVFDIETMRRSGMPNVLWIQFTTPPEENVLRPLDPGVELPSLVACCATPTGAMRAIRTGWTSSSSSRRRARASRSCGRTATWARSRCPSGPSCTPGSACCG